jgi:hypothetical protein
MVIIEVTQKHIDKGGRREAGSCPVSLAINDVLADGVYVRVVANAYLFKMGILEITSVRLDENTKQFIIRFDEGESVQPFSMEVEISNAFLKEEKQKWKQRSK